MTEITHPTFQIVKGRVYRLRYSDSCQRILEFLRHRGCSQKELYTGIHTHRPNLLDHLRELEREGLIQRTERPRKDGSRLNNGIETVYSLTEKAQQALGLSP